ncbi:MAG: sigma-70 family RNA polymerase sigma factor [Clostridiales bacterium]|nr:sigma-70 family RNA polymerase sigma factor [Clostridiales bacterium]
MSNTVKVISVENDADEELLDFARKGDEKALSELVKRMFPVARSRAYSYRNSFVEQEDLTQEGMLGLLDAFDGFDHKKGVAFRTYADKCINNRMLNAIRNSETQKNRPLNSYVQLDEEKLVSVINVEDDFLNVEELCTIIDKKLSSFEKSVIKQYLCGYSYNEIAVRLNSTEKAVDNAIQRVRRKIRNED